MIDRPEPNVSPVRTNTLTKDVAAMAFWLGVLTSGIGIGYWSVPFALLWVGGWLMLMGIIGIVFGKKEEV